MAGPSYTEFQEMVRTMFALKCQRDMLLKVAKEALPYLGTMAGKFEAFGVNEKGAEHLFYELKAVIEKIGK